jgi:hypothetical protein
MKNNKSPSDCEAKEIRILRSEIRQTIRSAYKGQAREEWLRVCLRVFDQILKKPA